MQVIKLMKAFFTLDTYSCLVTLTINVVLDAKFDRLDSFVVTKEVRVTMQKSVTEKALRAQKIAFWRMVAHAAERAPIALPDNAPTVIYNARLLVNHRIFQNLVVITTANVVCFALLPSPVNVSLSVGSFWMALNAATMGAVYKDSAKQVRNRFIYILF